MSMYFDPRYDHRILIEDDSSGDIHELIICTAKETPDWQALEMLEYTALTMAEDPYELYYGWIVDHFFEILKARPDLFNASMSMSRTLDAPFRTDQLVLEYEEDIARFERTSDSELIEED